MKTSIGRNERIQYKINGYNYFVNMQLPEEEFKPFIEALALAQTDYSHKILMQVSQLMIRINNGRKRIDTPHTEV